MTSFWEKLPRPFFTVAPMADVTDPAFRRLLASYGKPDITWTEFVSADGLYHTREIQKMPDEENPLMRDLQFSEGEHPIVAQLFSAKPDMMRYGAELVAKLGFDGIDINMGCPDRSIEKQGCGAAMIKNPEGAAEVIRAAKEAGIPVSVKTRVGYNTEILESWLPAILAEKPVAVTLHLRTRKEMSAVPAKWELMRRAVEIRDRLAPEVLLIGNGDVKDLTDAREKAQMYGADGVMIGRGIFGNPWVFAGKKSDDVPLPEKLTALIELARGFEQLRPAKSFHILKKHIKAFVTGFDGAADLRARLMDTKNADELSAIIGNN